MSLGQRLNKRITVQGRVPGKDAFGQPVTTWQPVTAIGANHDGKLWAEILDVSGKQYVAAQATQNAVQTTITIRTCAAITDAMRIVYGSDVYDIETILGQTGRMQALMCKRGVSNG